MAYFMLFLFALLTIINCNSLEYDGCPWKDEDITKCLTKNSYSYVSCKSLSDVTGNLTDRAMVWIPYGKTTQCREPESACRCYEKNFWNWYEQDCECYNPTPVPKLPPIGVVRWAGSFYSWDQTVYKVRGEVHKLNNGDFMNKEYSSMTNITIFEILIADENGAYTKYTGNTRNKTCNVEKQKSEKKLQSMWGRFHADDSNINLESDHEKANNKRRQIWKKRVDHGEWEDIWTWEVVFDDVTRTAVPLRYEYHVENYVNDEDKHRERNYKFTELNEGERSFQLIDYCLYYSSDK